MGLLAGQRLIPLVSIHRWPVPKGCRGLETVGRSLSIPVERISNLPVTPGMKCNSNDKFSNPSGRYLFFCISHFIISLHLATVSRKQNLVLTIRRLFIFPC